MKNTVVLLIGLCSLRTSRDLASDPVSYSQ